MNAFLCAFTISTKGCTQPHYIARHDIHVLHTLPRRNLPGIIYIEADACNHTATKYKRMRACTSTIYHTVLTAQQCKSALLNFVYSRI